MPTRHASLLFWPQPAELATRVKLALFFCVFFYLFYGSGAWLADSVRWRFSIGFDWEQHVPFWPNSAWIFLSISPLMLLPVFIIREPQDFQLAIRILCVQVVIASICFVLLPVTLLYPPRVSHGVLPLVFIIADALNLGNNELPSLHVCFAITIAGLLMSYAATTMRIVIGSWAIAIVISTMTIHEHHALAIAAGAAMAITSLWVWRCSACINRL